MAQKYPTHDAGPTDWSVAAWDDDDTNSKDEAKPGAADDVDFTANSGSIVLNEDTPALTSLEIDGGTLTLDGDRTIDAALVLNNGTLNLATHKLTLAAGSTFTHTGGTLGSSGDWQASIDANGATFTGISATNLMRVYHGKDGGANDNLFFVRPHGPLGVGGLTRRLA